MAKRTAPNLAFLTTAAPAAPGPSLFEQGTTATPPVQMIPLADLADNPWQPRTTMDSDDLADLAAVIRSQGFAGVLIARPHPSDAGRYQIPWGHRRREAARLAGLTSLPVMVQPLSDEEMIAATLTENIQRTDLTPLEEGRLYVLMHEEFGLTWEQVAGEVKKRIGYIENRVRVARAPADVQALVQQKPDSLRAVTNLVRLPDPAHRGLLIAGLLDGTITTDDVASAVAGAGLPRVPEPVPPVVPPAVVPSPGSAMAAEPDPGLLPVAALPAPVPPAAVPPAAPSAPQPAPVAAPPDPGRLGASMLGTALKALQRYQAHLASQVGERSAQELHLLGEILHLSSAIHDQSEPGRPAPPRPIINGRIHQGSKP